MKIILYFIFHSLLFSQQYKFISFDLSDQFGFVSKDGGLVWNQDWYSNNLMFDGTWLNYPKMYGSFIKCGYMKEQTEIEQVDSNKVTSFFNYEQGDYLLDIFSLGVKYKNNHRNIKFKGFKRGYLGPYNQYYNNSNQPIQQSYIFSYNSDKDLDSGGITIGHFNTYSGLPDINNQGLINNKITSLNVFINKNYRSINWLISMDQFMQRYQVFH